jgi:hypothetical protein
MTEGRPFLRKNPQTPAETSMLHDLPVWEEMLLGRNGNPLINLQHRLTELHLASFWPLDSVRGAWYFLFGGKMSSFCFCAVHSAAGSGSVFSLVVERFELKTGENERMTNADPRLVPRRKDSRAFGSTWSLSTALKLELHTKIFEESVYKILRLLSKSMRHPLTKSQRLEIQSHFGSKMWRRLLFDGVNHASDLFALVCRSPPYMRTAISLSNRFSGGIV